MQSFRAVIKRECVCACLVYIEEKKSEVSTHIYFTGRRGCFDAAA